MDGGNPGGETLQTELKVNFKGQGGMLIEVCYEAVIWEEMWLVFGQRTYPYDENFIAVSNYALNNEIKNNPHKVELEEKYKKLVKEYLDKENN